MEEQRGLKEGGRYVQPVNHPIKAIQLPRVGKRIENIGSEAEKIKVERIA
jgi:hypothetical protein